MHTSLPTRRTRYGVMDQQRAFVELDGVDHWPFIGDVDAVVAEIADFVVGERRLPTPQRLRGAVLFTDLVASTERAAVTR